MKRRPFALALLVSCLVLGAASLAPAQVGGRGGQPGAPGGVRAFGSFYVFDQFMMTITQLNMTPDFTLDSETKTKLQAVREEWNKAQAKFREENKEEFQQLNQDLAAAYKAQDQEKIKEASQKQRDLLAKGPEGDEFIAKAKAALPAEQLKVVEAKIAKNEADMKARWAEMEKREVKESTSVPKGKDKE